MSQTPDLRAVISLNKQANKQVNKHRRLFYFLILFAFTSSISLIALIKFDWPTAFAQQNPPVANPDTYNVHGLTNVGDVRLNDSDPNASASYVSLTTHGTLQGAYPGIWSYTPYNGFVGTDSFSYKICNAYGCSAPATVTLNVQNIPPVAIPDFYIVKGVSLIGPMYSNDFDVDDPFPAANQEIYFDVFPQHGVIQGAPNGKKWFYPSPSSYNGFDFFIYHTYDRLGASSNPALVMIFVINDDNHNAGKSCKFEVGKPAAESFGKPAALGVGKPVNVTNGNMYLEQTDYRLTGVGPSINLSRFYNSIIQTGRLFGRGWATDYDESLQFYGEQMLRLNSSDGKAIYFGRDNTSQPFVTGGSQGVYGQIVKNADSTYTLTYKEGLTKQFNSSGKLLWIKDRNNNQTTLSYLADGRIEKVIDPFGRELLFATNPTNGLVTQISDSMGVVASYSYTSGGELQTVTYADGSKYDFLYTTVSGKVLMTEVKDALGNTLEKHAYDSSARATTSEVQGGVEKYTLNYVSTTETDVTDALGHVTKYYFDKSKNQNLVTKIEGVCGCGGSSSQVTTWEYDDQLNVKKQTDALNRETNYTFDSNGNMLTMTDVLGTVTYTYNTFGQILTHKDRMNGITTLTYDANGNLQTIKNALDKTITLGYDTRGQLQTITDPLNHTTTLTWDAQGRLTKTKDAQNHETNFVYDSRVRLTSATNALNQTTSYQYDAADRLKKVVFADNNFAELTRDLAGRRTKVKDSRGNETNFAYDSAYRLTSVTDALNHTTTYAYDLMSNLTSITDALNQATNYEYDDFNRLKKVIYPAAVSGGTRLEETIEYDVVGNVKKRVDTALRQTLYDYDNANRLIKTTDAANQITQFEYNARSQMTKVTDALNQQYTFAYDPLGRLLSKTRASLTATFEYDAVGNRTKRTDYNGAITTYAYDELNRLTTIAYPDLTSASYSYDALSRLATAMNQNGTVTFAYDNRGRLQSETNVFGKVVSYGYDANGNKTELRLDGALSASYQYDAANRLTQITDSSNGVYGYGYDPTDKLTSLTRPNGVTTNYEYDGLSRLTRLKHSTSTITLFDYQYAYNTAQQINQITEPSRTRTFSYDNVDRVTATTNTAGLAESYAYDSVGNRTSSHLSASYTHQPFNKLTATSGATYSYNNNGNMTSRTDASGLWQLAYDFENRLKQVTRPDGGSVSYKYDALGRRVQRQPSVGVSTNYTHDGQDVILDQNSDSTTIAYINGFGIDEKLKQTIGATTSYFLQDHLGSTVGLVDQAGSITSQTSYDSFGNASSSMPTRYGYTGRELDDYTGLMYYRARFYDSQIGRFISEDPLGFKGGDINLYAYVENDPLNWRDPSGLIHQAWHESPYDGRLHDDPGAGLESLCNDKKTLKRDIGWLMHSIKKRQEEVWRLLDEARLDPTKPGPTKGHATRIEEEINRLNECKRKCEDEEKAEQSAPENVPDDVNEDNWDEYMFRRRTMYYMPMYDFYPVGAGEPVPIFWGEPIFVF